MGNAAVFEDILAPDRQAENACSFLAGQWRQAEWKIVTLLEILRLYADSYCRLAAHLQSAALQITLAEDRESEFEHAKGVISTLVPSLRKMLKECDRLGMEASRDAIAITLKRWNQYHNMRTLMMQCSSLNQTIESELQRRICFILPSSSQRLYEYPCEKWERILAVFPDAREDVEEMNRCMAFNRYPAAVFHVLLAVEHALVSLGKFIGVTDKKPGWDATSKALAQILATGRTPATPAKIRKHFAFLELVNKDMQSMKMAWRNKVSHAANHLFVMTSDFKPEVAEKIITSCHGFMLLLATEGPNRK